MKIYIPTKGRVQNQLTLENLPPDLYVRTILVCPKSEAFRHRQRHPHAEVLEQPDEDMGISEKRKWIIDICDEDKLVMLDDDCRFAVRREDDPGLFRKANNEDITLAFAELESMLCEEIPHAGFAVRGAGIGELARQGGWQKTGKRMMYSLGYYLPIVRYWAEWGRIKTHEDIDITLQLLSMGFPNAVNHTFVTDQKFGAPGGCTNERTVESNNEDCLKLQALHPEYVTIEEKTYTSSVPRMETRCAWQKCLKDGITFRTEYLKNKSN